MAYFSNGSEGEILNEQCCDCLVAEDAPCPILLVQMTYNYDQLKDDNKQLREAMTMLVDDSGQCKMKPIIDNHLVEDKKTLPLF